MDECKKNYADNRLYIGWFYLFDILENKTICIKIYQWLPGMSVGGGEGLQMDTEKFGVVTVLYTFVKIHTTVLVNMSEFYYM